MYLYLVPIAGLVIFILLSIVIYRKYIAGFKDYNGCLPVFMQITDGKVHEVQRAGSYSFSKGSVVVVDRGYVDYNWLGD